jgi:chitosanase
MPTPVPMPIPVPISVPAPMPATSTGLSFSGISNDQIQSILQLTSIFENSTTTLQYDYVENIGDGRGYTFGFVGFCSGTGDGSQMLAEFSRLIGGNDQDTTKYLKAMLVIDAQGQDMNSSLVGLDNFVNYVKKNGKRPEWIQANLNIANKLYVVPSQNKATQLGLSSPLSKGQLYDCYLNQGEDGALKLINQTGKVNNETDWLKAFLQNRYNVLAKDKTWAESVDRIKVYQNLLNTNPTLKLPFNVTCYGDNYTLDV